ncbi:MAG TPA: vitamin K epoxide reductase family protein [Rubrobacter sp.]
MSARRRNRPQQSNSLLRFPRMRLALIVGVAIFVAALLAVLSQLDGEFRFQRGRREALLRHTSERHHARRRRCARQDLPLRGLPVSRLRPVQPRDVPRSGGCETVQSSSYTTILGIPVATLGIVAYVGLLFSALLRGEAGVYLGFLISLVGVLFSAYLTYLEVFVIHALCQWCVASAAVMVAALVCSAFGVWRLMKEH